MPLVSKADRGIEQADGRVPIIETHTTEDGRVFKYQYLSDGVADPEHVKEARAAIIEAELASRAAALVAVVGTEVPFTKHEFLSMFTQAERIAIRAEAKTNAIVGDFMEMMNASGGVYEALAQPGLDYLAAIGKLTPERAANFFGGS